jgi:hypothetical protein
MPYNSEKASRVALTLNNDLKAELEELAAVQRRPLAEFIRLILEDHVLVNRN